MLHAIVACPVCFGQNDSPLALGINDGIFVMLGIIALLWVAFGSFFIYLWRKARLAEDTHEGLPDRLRQGYGGPPKRAESRSRAKVEGGPQVPQEGTV